MQGNGKVTVLDFDDLCDGNDHWDILQRLKEKNPAVKATLFAIPTRCSDALYRKFDAAKDWIELAIHGWRHARHECLAWTSEETVDKLGAACTIYPGFAKVFKAPNWETCDELYQGCNEAGVAIADHIRNIEILPAGVKHYIYNLRLRNDAYRRVHGHLQPWAGTGLEEAFTTYAQLAGPFAFVSEVATAHKELAV